jgi:FimV-like protein
MMLSILEANPKKFNNNINALYANIGLRIPNIEEIITIDPDEALSEVQYQHLLWNQQYISISSAIDKSGMEEIDVRLSNQNSESNNKESDRKVVSRNSLDTQIEEDFPDVVIESEIIINEDTSNIDVQNLSIMEVASTQNNEVIDETLKKQDNLPAKNIRRNKSSQLDKLTDIWESYWMLLVLLLVMLIGLIVWYKSHKSKQETMAEVEPNDDLKDSIKMTKIGTKLDLARAYVDMGEPSGALNILQEVLDEGNAEQIQLAKKLLNDLKR